MKSFIILTILLISTILSSKVHKFQKSYSKNKNRKNNLPIDLHDDSYNWGYATSDNYMLQNSAGFIEPQIMEKIPIHLNKPYTGVIGEASGFVTDKFYYNGSLNLSAVHVECNLYSTNPQGCTRNSGCGWCGDKSTCIPGNEEGPLAPCLRNTFLYTSPSTEWNPLKAGNINILAVDRKGQPLTSQTWEPEMNKMDINNPYK
jgi:hypothetical protein